MQPGLALLGNGCAEARASHNSTSDVQPESSVAERTTADAESQPHSLMQAAQATRQTTQNELLHLTALVDSHKSSIDVDCSLRLR